MITRIEIQGFKSIKSLDLHLGPLNILLGGNGVGKSNFISAFSLVRSIYNQAFQKHIQSKGGANSHLHFGQKVTQQIYFEFEFESRQGHANKYMLTLAPAQDGLFIEAIKTAYLHEGAWYERTFEENVSESQFTDIKESQAYYVNQRLKEFDVYHFHDTSDSSPMKAASDIHDNWYLKRDGSNLAAFLYYLKEQQPKHFRRIEKTIQSIAPFFDRFVLEPNRLNPEKIKLEWREKGYPESYFNAYHLSDGTLRFICLATLLMQPNPPQTIIIDEPELGLHPVAINKLAALVRKASATSQVILSTQSINLVDNFAPEDIIVADRASDGHSIFNRLEAQALENWLDDYTTLGDLWGQNKIGAQPYYKAQ